MTSSRQLSLPRIQNPVFSVHAHSNMAAFGAILCLGILMAVIAAFYDQISVFKKNDLDDFVLCALLSVLGFAVTYYFIPIVKEIMLHNNMWGYDINKNGRELNIRVYVSKQDVLGGSDSTLPSASSSHLFRASQHPII